MASKKTVKTGAKRAKVKKRRAEQRRAEQQQAERQESSAAEVVTVAWTLSVVTVLGCDLGTASLWLFLRANPEHERLAMLAGLLFFAAVTIGIISLALLPIVCRLRHTPPPRGMIVFGIFVAAAPLGMLAWQFLSR